MTCLECFYFRPHVHFLVVYKEFGTCIAHPERLPFGSGCKACKDFYKDWRLEDA